MNLTHPLIIVYFDLRHLYTLLGCNAVKINDSYEMRSTRLYCFTFSSIVFQIKALPCFVVNSFIVLSSPH
jgi:hypothetical protein